MKELTLAEKIVELLKSKPGLSDRKITDELFGSGKPQQPVNNVCRQLEKAGILIRKKTGEYPIQNYLASQEVVVLSPQIEIAEGKIEEHFLEDAIKKILEGWLIAQGWKVKVAWAHDRGSDIDATKENERWVIEVKGKGKHDQARGNYFLGMLGETLQRMNDSNAKYSIALPDIQRYRNLWQRFPTLAKSRTGITALFIDANGNVKELL